MICYDIGAIKQPPQQQEYSHISNWQYHEMMTKDNESLNKLNSVVANSHDWKNIQEVVRLAFKHVYDAIHDQEAKFHFLTSELNSKATKNELDVKLSNKPSHSEMNKLFSEISDKINSKMDKSEQLLTGIVLIK